MRTSHEINYQFISRDGDITVRTSGSLQRWFLDVQWVVRRAGPEVKKRFSRRGERSQSEPFHNLAVPPLNPKVSYFATSRRRLDERSSLDCWRLLCWYGPQASAIFADLVPAGGGRAECPASTTAMSEPRGRFH